MQLRSTLQLFCFLLTVATLALPAKLALHNSSDVVTAEELRHALTYSDEAYTIKGTELIIRGTEQPDGTHTTQPIYVAFRGSHELDDWAINSQFKAADLGGLFPSLRGYKAHQGFLKRFSSILKADSKDQRLSMALDQAAKEKRKLILTGHSLGGAVSVLATLWALHRVIVPDNLLCITFGSPLVGDLALADYVLREKEQERWGEKFLHVVNRHDIVPRILLSSGTGAQKLLRGMLSYPFSSRDVTQTNQTPAAGRKEVKDGAAKIKSGLADAAKRVGKDIGGSSSLAFTVFKALPLGLLDPSRYRPFGCFLLFTDGPMLLKQPALILHMLYLSLQDLSNAIDTKADFVIREHFIGSYQAVIDNMGSESASQHDSSPVIHFAQEAKDMAQLGVMLGIIDISVKQKDIQDTVSKLSVAVHEKLVFKDAFNIDKDWLEVQSCCMDLIWEFSKMEHPGGLQYYEAFRLERGNLTQINQVDVARRTLKLFWESILMLYGEGKLREDFFDKGGAWLSRAVMQYQRTCEPIDIANYYRLGMWKSWPIGERHYLEANNRPTAYVFLERKFSQEYPDVAPITTSSLEYARRLAEEVEAEAETAGAPRIQHVEL